MTLFLILLATAAAGIGSVWLAAALGFGVLSRFARYSQDLLSLAAGALLATALLNLLPEAFELSHQQGISPLALFATLLGGLLCFFLLDKAELWHHGHEHGAHHAGHAHDHGHTHHEHHHTHAHASTSGGWSVLLGDSVHAFGDGVLIASAFMADWHLGWVSALAVLAHEVPHHMGDLVVLRQQSNAVLRTAVMKVSLAGSVTALGGLVAYVLLSQLDRAVSHVLPYLLVLAASSFIYVALADLIPQLQKHVQPRQTATQIAWLLLGLGLVAGVSVLAHGH